jgi:rsbT co-antagonist protein RsbR
MQTSYSRSPEAAELKAAYGCTDNDERLLVEHGKFLTERIDEFIEAFYEWLSNQPEFAEFFPDGEAVTRVGKLQRAYWSEFFTQPIDADYVSKRERVGEPHARIDLPLTVYLASMNKATELFTEKFRDPSVPDDAWLSYVGAFRRRANIDTGIVVRKYNEVTNETIASQSQALMAMSTPVTQLWEGILMLPVVGLIDSRRAQDIMNAMLDGIAKSQARNFILDISGVGVVDTAVANHLIKITKATSLMGCETMISGISPSIAQTIVDLGIDVGEVRTTSTMRDGLDAAFARLGLKLEVSR